VFLLLAVSVAPLQGYWQTAARLRTCAVCHSKVQARLIVGLSAYSSLALTQQVTARRGLFNTRHVLSALSPTLLATAVVTQNQRLVHGRLDVLSYSAKRACHNNF
jgi:hypothetical protein